MELLNSESLKSPATFKWRWHFQLSRFRFQDFPKDEKLYLTAGHHLPTEPAGIRMEQQPDGSFFPRWSRLWWFLQICFTLKENWKKKTIRKWLLYLLMCRPATRKMVEMHFKPRKVYRLALGKGHARNRRLPTSLGHNRSQNSHPKRGIWLGNLQTCHGQTDTIKPVLGWCSRISPNIPR